MPRYRLDIEYDGTPFVGWQIQSNGASVQAALAHAIQRFCGDDAVPQGAGRTDTGVHALGQVAHVDLARDWPCDTVRDAINYHLKPDPVAVTACTAVDDGFHARFSAVRRHYLYRLRSRRARPVLDEHRVWWVPVPLDADAMHAAAQSLVGRHDFTTFRAAQCQAASPVKTLDVLNVATVGDEIHVRATARSFLHNQVRSLVGTLKLVGEGKWPVERVREVLAACDRRQCGALAPPWGLYLTGVDYPAQGEATASSACTDPEDVVQPD